MRRTFSRVVLRFSRMKSINRSPRSSWVCSTLRLFLSSDEGVWITSVSTDRSIPSEELCSSKKLALISWERNVLLSSCMLSSRPDLSRIRFGVGWVLVVEELPLQVVEQLLNPIFFSIRARSILIECQSFLNSKIDVYPIYCVLMTLLCIMQVLCVTRLLKSITPRSLWFVHRNYRQKEYCLSLARTLKKLLWIITLSCNGGSKRLRPENVLEELGNKNFVPESSVQYWNLLSTLPTRRRNISLVQHRSNSFLQWKRFLVKIHQVLFFVDLPLPWIGMQKSFCTQF